MRSLEDGLDCPLRVVKIASKADDEPALSGDGGHLKALYLARSRGGVNDRYADAWSPPKPGERRGAGVARSRGEYEHRLIDTAFFKTCAQQPAQKTEGEILECTGSAMKELKQEKRRGPACAPSTAIAGQRAGRDERNNFRTVEHRVFDGARICLLDEGTELAFWPIEPWRHHNPGQLGVREIRL